MYIDSHAHIFGPEYKEDLHEVLQRAEEHGIDAIIIPGTSVETSKEAIDLAGQYSVLYACVGYHPHEASKADERQLQEIEELSKHPRVVGVGEIGLDYFYDFTPKDLQRNILRQQLEMAVRRDLPVVIHTRESTEETINMVEQTVRQHPNWRGSAMEGSIVQGRRGVFHCFTGTAEQARTLFSFGFFVSYPGIVTFKNSPVLETIGAIGWENILLETDSPYLTPVPLRGKRNEPSNIPLIANKIAEICGTSPRIVADRTSANARFLFSLPD